MVQVGDKHPYLLVVFGRAGCAPLGTTADDFHDGWTPCIQVISHESINTGIQCLRKESRYPMSLLYCDTTRATQRVNYSLLFSVALSGTVQALEERHSSQPGGYKSDFHEISKATTGKTKK